MPDFAWPHLRVAINHDALAAVTHGLGAPRLVARLDLSTGAGEPLLLQSLQSLLEQAGRHPRRVEVVVHDALARWWRCEVPTGASRLRDLEAAARMRFERSFDEPATGWELRMAARADGAFACCALRRSLVQGLAGVVQARGARLMSLHPRMAALCDRLAWRLPADAWLVVPDEDPRLAIRARGALVAVRRLSVRTREFSAGWIEAVRREAAGLGLPVPAKVAWCGPVAPALVAAGDGWLHAGEPLDVFDLCGVQA